VRVLKGESWKIVIALLIVLLTASCSSKEESESGLQINDSGNSREKVNQTFKTTDRDKETMESEGDKVNSLLEQMTLEEKIGQLLMPAFREWEGENVTTVNEDIASIRRDYHLGGVILFRENFANRAQTRNMIEELQKQAAIPLMIGVDQEGGLVTRLPFFPRMPGNMALGATGNVELTRQVGLAIGSELRRLGIQVNFGPVLDINNNPDNPVIGVRSFGDEKEKVAAMGIAYMKGLNDAGVVAVGKHFPGHGDVDLDSHFVLPSSQKTLEQLSNLELQPFQKLIDEEIQGIMTAHITFNQIDPETIISKKDGLPIELPATLSPPLLTDLLRQDMGFQGVLFSDAMDMKAIADHFGPVEAAIRAVEAGVDIILMPENIDLVYHGLLEAVKSSRISEARIDQSVARILNLKTSPFFNENSRDTTFKSLSPVEALAVEQQVADASITVVHNDGIIPIEENGQEKIALVASSKSLLNSLENAVKPYHWKLEPILLHKFSNLSGTLTHGQNQLLESASKVLIVTSTATKQDRDADGWEMKTIQSVIDHNIPAIVIAARNPYDVVVLEGMEAFIAQYDSGTASFKATSDVIFGKIDATGQLPVQLSK
jgi:beta-N-acetylhexosaminidase